MRRLLERLLALILALLMLVNPALADYSLLRDLGAISTGAGWNTDAPMIQGDGVLPWQQKQGPPLELAQVTTDPSITNECPPTPPSMTNMGSTMGKCESTAPSFSLNLTASLLPERSLGDGTPTFTRATAAAHTDFEGITRQVPSGTARFQGARYVRNLLTRSDDQTVGGSWTAQAGAAVANNSIVDPYGVTRTLSRITWSAGNASVFQSYVATIGNRYVSQTWIKGVAGETVGYWVDYGSGGVDQRLNLTLNGSWQHISTGRAQAGSTGLTFAFRKDTPTGHTVTAIDIANLMLEDSTGATVTAPSEYVPALATANADSGAIGVRYFPYLNGNTVASNVVTEAQGAAITSARAEAAGGVTAGVVDSTGPLGYLAEGAGTQILATNDIRDMTTANWVLGATMTRARTSVGADGAASTATRLTGGAVAATNTVLLTIIAAASSRTYSAMVKRVTGTGPIRIIQTGTETDISSQLSTGTYKLVQLTGSILNVAMGFKIDTNGDAIDVDFNQFEAGGFATSRMAANGAARAADVLTYPSAGNFTNAQGALYAEYANFGATGTLTYVATILGKNSSSAERILYYAGDTIPSRAYDGTAVTNGPTVSAIPRGTVIKSAVTWSGTSAQVSSNGSAGTVGSYDGDWGMGATLSLGGDPLFGTIRNVRLYPQALSAARLQTMTAAADMWMLPNWTQIAANDETYRIRANQ
jgi:hypothetical protein